MATDTATATPRARNRGPRVDSTALVKLKELEMYLTVKIEVLDGLIGIDGPTKDLHLARRDELHGILSRIETSK